MSNNTKFSCSSANERFLSTTIAIKCNSTTRINQIKSSQFRRFEYVVSSLLFFSIIFLRIHFSIGNRDRLNREFVSYHNGVSLSTTNLNNPQPTSPPKIPLVTQNSMDSTYMYSKPEPYKPLSTDSRRTQTQYQAPSFREHSPTTSEYSRTETEENSMSKSFFRL